MRPRPLARRPGRSPSRLAGLATALVALAAGAARADAPGPPWFPAGAIAPATVARSVVARPDDRGNPGDMVLFTEPARTSARRGLTMAGTSLHFFGEQRGPGCNGVWWLVGPLAWACSDQADLSVADPIERNREASPVDGLAAAYFFVGQDGASAYASLQAAEEGTADRELEGGWGVAGVEQRSVSGESWVHTTKGMWIASRDLVTARPSTFRGEKVESGRIDFAWVRGDKASVWAGPSTKTKPIGSRARFARVRITDDSGGMVRLEDGSWMSGQDLARPRVADPPPEVSFRGEPWIDVDLATQTMVAYEGRTPVYATLVSTGRAGEDSTPRGVHRIWVKIVASDMGNSSRADAEAHYSLEDVPYVQFFDESVALHGTYWHRDFGHARSHGCVNLAPVDAEWMFGFTSPRVPAGWAAAYPTRFDPGSVVRVR